MVKAVDCKSILYEFESRSCLNKLETLSNWLARLSVKQVSNEHVGSSPAVSTSTYLYLLSLDTNFLSERGTYI